MKTEEFTNIDWEELAKFMANEMDASELQKFDDKISNSENRKEIVEQVKSDWENMENYKKNKEFNADNAWDKLHAKFEKDGLLENVKNTDKQFSYRFLLKIAAILVIGVLFTTVAYYIINNGNKTNWQVAETYKSNENLKVVLDDGSIVYLNANSKLYYPEKFAEGNRVVEFEGDAFFEIAKNPNKPFIIKAKDAEIKVLGTSFNVNTNTSAKDLEVLVETGKVKLSIIDNEKESVTLEPGYMGTIEKKKALMHKNTDKNYLSWKTKKFDFSENIKLGDAIKILNRAYNTNIVCENYHVCDKILNSTFDNDPIDKILNLICETYSLNMKTSDGSIVLSNK
jgi:ferric-dicitrate binding protein FerR (iron transport regulator)